MKPVHTYRLTTEWTGNTGSGTKDYRSYMRNHIVSVAGKPEIAASSDPAFRGDATRYNPEELLVASLSGCHMLWYLHLCANADIVVTAYTDHAVGTMVEEADGSGRFEEVQLNPVVNITDGSRIAQAIELHLEANRLCFIANSVNFKVTHNASCTSDETPTQ